MRKMTSRERMLAAIHHAPVDRVPVSPWRLGRIPWDSPLGLQLVARTDPWMETGFGCDPFLGASAPVESHQYGAQKRTVIHAGNRELVAVYTTTAQTTACTEYPCKTRGDIEALLTMPYEQPHPDLEQYEAFRKRVGDDGMTLVGLGNGLCFPNDMLGTEYCSLLWASEPEIIRRMVALAAERVFRVVEEACRGGVDCFRIVGGEYATQLMGMRAWEELVVPFDRPLVEMIHSYGGLAHYHNHGNMYRFLDHVADLGIDSLDPVEQPPYGDISMGEAMARIGDRVCLVGGLDDMEVLETRSRAEVVSMAEALLDETGTVGYMLGGTSSGIFGEAAAHNFMALVDVAEAYG